MLEIDSQVGGPIRFVDPVIEKVEERCHFLEVPNEVILIIFSNLSDIQDLHSLSGVCSRFRMLVGNVRILKEYKGPCERVVRDILFPGRKRRPRSHIRIFRQHWKQAPWHALFQLKEDIRNKCLKRLSLEKLTQIEGKDPVSNIEVLKFLDFRNSLVHRWKKVISKNRYGDSFTISYNFNFSQYSFHAFLDGLAESPSVKRLTILPSFTFPQMKLMLDYTLKEKLNFEELHVVQSRSPELKTTFALISILSEMPDLKKVTIAGIDLHLGAFPMLLEGLSRQQRLSHVSIELLKVDNLHLTLLRDFILNIQNLEFLALKGLTDSDYNVLSPAFLECTIPMVSLRKGKLTNTVASDLGQLIRKNLSIKHLDLAHNFDIHDEGSKSIIKEARKRSDLSIAISDNLFLIS